MGQMSAGWHGFRGTKESSVRGQLPATTACSTGPRGSGLTTGNNPLPYTWIMFAHKNIQSSPVNDVHHKHLIIIEAGDRYIICTCLG